MTSISIHDLKTLCVRALEKAGAPPPDAALAAEHYLENEMSGKASHGIIRVVQAAKLLRKNGASTDTVETVTDTGSLLVIDARKKLAPAACHRAMREGIKRAHTHGLALVGIHNYTANSGSMAFYLRRIAEDGLAAIMGCNSVAAVAPPGGRARMIGTNPVGIAIPGENGDALIADLATSAIAYGKIMVMKDKGQPVPEGYLIDGQGNPSTDPKDVYDGAILPLAGHKGFALGLMVELLAGPLLGGKALKKDDWDDDGLFMILIDPSRTGRDSVYAEISAALEEIRSSPTRPGETRVSLPGDRSARTLEETLARGTVDVADKTLKDLKDLSS